MRDTKKTNTKSSDVKSVKKITKTENGRNDPVRMNPPRPGRGKNPKYNSGKANRGDGYKDIINPEEDYKTVPLEVEQRQIKDLQKVEYVTLGKGNRTGNVSVCQGCTVKISHEKYFTSPMNLVFRYKMYRKYRHEGRWVDDKVKKYGYFHAEDMCCIRNFDELRRLKIEDVYMTNGTFLQLDEEHLKELHKRGHLEAILNTRRLLRS